LTKTRLPQISEKCLLDYFYLSSHSIASLSKFDVDVDDIVVVVIAVVVVFAAVVFIVVVVAVVVIVVALVVVVLVSVFGCLCGNRME